LINNHKINNNGIIELKKRIIFLICAIIIFRIGSFIPIPGINISIVSKIFSSHHGFILDTFNMFSGGSLSRASIFALGIMPYISSSIIVQLLSLTFPYLKKLKKEGESGNKKINKYTRYVAFIVSLVQAVSLSISLPYFPGMQNLIINPDKIFYFTAIFNLVSGSMFLMWLSELISEFGIGNGTSILIFIGIVANLPFSVGLMLKQFSENYVSSLKVFLVLTFIFVSIFFVVFIERCQRKILIRYASRQRGNRIYSQQFTHLPLKLNISGVMPAIFASSVVIFPSYIISWLIERYSISSGFFYKIYALFKNNESIYVTLYSFSIIFFCFFYSNLALNPRETANNLKRSGAFIPGIRPGEKTEKYIKYIMLKLTCIGSLYITMICLIPEFVKKILKMPFYFGGTSLLIVVLVIIDFISQMQTLLMSGQYESILKKSNLYFSSKKKKK